MNVKKCNYCKKWKKETEFRKWRKECKECEKLKAKLYRRTKEGLIKTIYDNQKQHSKRRRHPSPSYTKNELKEWLYSQKLFHELYDNWKMSNYTKDLIPSVDRKDDSKYYLLNNIQLMTWFDNNEKAKKDKKSGKLSTAGYKFVK